MVHRFNQILSPKTHLAILNTSSLDIAIFLHAIKPSEWQEDISNTGPLGMGEGGRVGGGSGDEMQFRCYAKA